MALFKKYIQNQPMLLPLTFDELIDKNDMSRVVNSIIDSIDLSPLIKQYKGGGASSYNPIMLLKVITYAYTTKLYSSRQIEDRLKGDVRYMWLSANTKVDHTTISRFRTKKVAPIFEEIFTQVIMLLMDKGYLEYENYFLDGTKIEANANKYSYVYKKNTKRYRAAVQEEVHRQLKKVDELQQNEDERYSDITPEEITKEKIQEVAKKINDNINEKMQSKMDVKKQKTIVKHLNTDLYERAKKYEEQEETLGDRNSYSKTDPDATFMKMKEDTHKPNADPKAGYNVQIGTENQFIVGYSINQKANDVTSLIEHVEKLKENYSNAPKTIIADAGYGSEENYEYLEKEEIEGIVKYFSFYKEIKGKVSRFDKNTWEFDKKNNQYICPNNKKLLFTHETNETSTNGYKRIVSHYKCESCVNCPFIKDCILKYQKVNMGVRMISTSRRNDEFREKTKEKLLSEKGRELSKKRGIEVETVFGDIKQNFKLKRFVHRGLEKVSMEFGLTALAHNIRKIMTNEEIRLAI
jgi:transposase